MQYIKGNNIGKASGEYHLWTFDSVNDLIAHADHPNKQYSDRFDPSYNSTKNFADAAELFRNGWHDIRPTVEGHMQPLREELGRRLDVATERIHDLCGYEPDIDRYLAGELECMWDDGFIEAPKDGKVFRLLVDCSSAWMNTPEDIARRGAVLCALVEAFTMCGMQLEIWTERTVKSSSVRNTYASVLTRVTRAGEMLDIDSAMFCVGHPDYSRRFHWGFLESLEIGRTVFGHVPFGDYGLARQGAHHADRVGASTVVSLDGNSALDYKPLDWILEQLEAQGVYEGGE